MDNKAWFESEDVPVEGFEENKECKHLVIVIRSGDKYICTNCPQEFVPVGVE